MAGPAAVGIFATASKLFGVVLVPIDLLTQVFRPRVSRAWADGDDAGRRLSRAMSISLCGTGVLAGAGLFAVALLLPRLLPKLADSEWGAARTALMYLAFVPPVYGLQRANVITAISRGVVGAYATAVMASAALGVGTLVVLAPAYGWRAACVATWVYLATSCAGTWLLARRAGVGVTVRRESRPAADNAISQVAVA